MKRWPEKDRQIINLFLVLAGLTLLGAALLQLVLFRPEFSWLEHATK